MLNKKGLGQAVGFRASTCIMMFSTPQPPYRLPPADTTKCPISRKRPKQCANTWSHPYIVGCWQGSRRARKFLAPQRSYLPVHRKKLAEVKNGCKGHLVQLFRLHIPVAVAFRRLLFPPATWTPQGVTRPLISRSQFFATRNCMWPHL